MKGLFINETKEVDMKKILTLTAILLTANFALANEGTPPPPHEGKGPHHRGGHRKSQKLLEGLHPRAGPGQPSPDRGNEAREHIRQGQPEAESGEQHQSLQTR